MRIEGEDYVYEGEVNSAGVPHGKGKVTFEDGEIYEGDFANGEYNGIGKMTFEDGEIYEGEFRNGYMNGNGQITYPNGSVQYGVWDDDVLVKEIGWKRPGDKASTVKKAPEAKKEEKPVANKTPAEPKPVCVKPDPKELAKEYLRGYEAGKKGGYDEGYKKGKSEGWSDGYKLGKGGADKDKQAAYDDGHKKGSSEGWSRGYDVGKKSGYDDGYKKGKSEGWSDGYKAGKASAPVSSSSGSSSSSSSTSVTRNGRSGLYNKSYYDPTTKYKGEKKGKLGGGGDYYEGEYEYWAYGGYDVPHGRGKMYKNGECVIDGFFVMGNKEGYCWEKTEDGDIYEGNFSNNLRHGLGRLVKKSGVIVEAIFVKGKTDDSPIVHVTYPNGNVFEGRVQAHSDYKYFTSGTMRYSDGGVYTGSWGGYNNGYHNCWRSGKYVKGSKTYEGSWSDEFVAYSVTLTEYGKTTKIEKQKIK